MFKQTTGIIKDVPTKYEDKELMDELESEIPILKVERLMKRDGPQNLKKTRNVRITFKGRELPNRVDMYGCKFKVELYLFPVKQCQNCWGYGHKTNVCKRPKKCISCGERHDEHGPEQCQVRCINCRGNHAANSAACPEKIKQRKIAQKMQQEKLTFQEAKNSFLQNRFQLLEDYEDEFPSLDDEEGRSEVGTSISTKRAWRRKTSQRASNRQEREDGTSQQRRNENRMNTSIRTIPENPHKSTEYERILAEMRTFWRNVRLVGKLKQLQEAIKDEVYNKQSETRYEEVIIKTSTVIGEIIDELVDNMATGEESNCKATEQNNQSNGE